MAEVDSLDQLLQPVQALFGVLSGFHRVRSLVGGVLQDPEALPERCSVVGVRDLGLGFGGVGEQLADLPQDLLHILHNCVAGHFVVDDQAPCRACSRGSSSRGSGRARASRLGRLAALAVDK